MSEYWENRSELAYTYRGEKFYTITPISLYHHRRKFVSFNILKHIRKSGSAAILDYGCGDGWYLADLARDGAYRLYGCDISPGFIQRARLACPPDVRLADMPEGSIPFGDRFDFVYSIAVLAHILSEEDVRRTVVGARHGSDGHRRIMPSFSGAPAFGPSPSST